MDRKSCFTHNLNLNLNFTYLVSWTLSFGPDRFSGFPTNIIMTHWTASPLRTKLLRGSDSDRFGLASLDALQVGRSIRRPVVLLC